MAATPKVQINARLDPSLYADLHEWARVRTVSVSSVVEQAIRAMIQQETKTKGKT